MATLAILQRYDSNLVLLTTTNDASELASTLASMQPFEVEVFAEFPGKSAFYMLCKVCLKHTTIQMGGTPCHPQKSHKQFVKLLRFHQGGV